MEKSAQAIREMVQGQKTFFIRFRPEIIDFTNPEVEVELEIHTKKTSFTIGLRKKLRQLIPLLQHTIFKSGNNVICWNIKPFFSYARYKTGVDFKFDGVLADLKIIGAYLSKDYNAKSWQEAVGHMSDVVGNHKVFWRDIYKPIHLPLIKKVIPQMEIKPVIDQKRRQILHAYYEIEGQVNGRLKCMMAFLRGFNPHSLGPEQRGAFLPYGEHNKFMYLDYRHNEVSVLQWLSGDKTLAEMLVGLDFYESLFEMITGEKCNSEKRRKFSKMAFLPVIYGIATTTLAENLKISNKFAEHIVNKLNRLFPSAMSFVKNQQLHYGYATDCLGRVRKFDNSHRVRNFVIQSPASMVCLEKLIKLSEKTKYLGFSVHDGYGLYVPEGKCKQVSKIAKEVLESPSNILPGLKLKVSCKIGPTLNDLIPI